MKYDYEIGDTVKIGEAELEILNRKCSDIYGREPWSIQLKTLGWVRIDAIEKAISGYQVDPKDSDRVGRKILGKYQTLKSAYTTPNKEGEYNLLGEYQKGVLLGLEIALEYHGLNQ
jgi:hypothetical protein